MQHGHVGGAVLEQHRLGDLQLQALGRQARGGQGRDDGAHQTPVAELGRRQVHRQAHVVGPLGRLGAGVAQDPLAQRDDQADLLGQRDEVGRRDHAPIRVAPTQQRLAARHPLVAQIVERLVEQLELAGLQRAAQVQLQGAARLQLLVHGAFEEMIGAAPVGLGAVEGHVGLFQQLVGVLAVGGRGGHADAGADHHLMALQVEGRGHGLDDASRQTRGPGHVLQAGLDHGELVAAQAGHGVAFAHAAAQPLGGHAQQGVAQRVAQGVVDGLEAVQVDEVDGQLITVASAAGQGVGEVLLEEDAVGQLGQRVVVRQPRDLGLGPLALGDVLGDAQQVLRLAGGVAEGDLLGAQNGHAAVLARHVVFLNHADLARLQHLAIALDIDRGQFGGVEVGVGLAHHLLPREAQGLLAGAVQQHVAMVVGALDEHHRGHGLDDGGHEGLGALDLVLGGGQVGHTPTVGLVGRLQQAQHRADAQITSAFGDDEAAQQVRGPIGQAVGGEGGQLGLGVDDQRLAVHQGRDRAIGVEGAAVLGGHAQEEGVALDDTDGAVFGVDDGNDQRVRLFAEPVIQGLAQVVLTRRRQGRNGIPQGEHCYASTREGKDHSPG